MVIGVGSNRHEELAQLSHEVDLLVVGARSYGRPRRLPFVGTSTTLVREPACRVLVLPRGATKRAAATTGATTPQLAA
jgi:nucleotide-binding universal stress UspA family protein